MAHLISHSSRGQNKQRLDTLVVQRGLVESRERAKQLILAGEVVVSGSARVKPGQLISSEAEIVVKQPPRYVSRGGLKLEKALQVFQVDVRGRVAIDVGASTGGFTDCLLQHGAKFVYAVDVGHGQLAWKIRQDPRVCVIEGTNIRTIDVNRFKPPVKIGVVDVSFISLQKVLPIVTQIVDPTGDVLALVKPQFEAGREHVGKGGVVREVKVHVQVLRDLLQFIHGLNQFVMGISYSPIRGPAGNIEYLIWFKAGTEDNSMDWEKRASQVVQEAHTALQ
ncbi:TlyA family rRNA (cytidine-2'-O)-methyltransferase [Candidatus Poribacteria bacterium]|nr:MAG: TlyA family rRNA (cytidine-2'-O)-methyltransferase [Candidatus Poribacteria bacterium]